MVAFVAGIGTVRDVLSNTVSSGFAELWQQSRKALICVYGIGLNS